MTKPIARDPMYRRRGFNAEIIELSLRPLVLSYKLSYRDLVEMMAEHGVELSHTTILRWVQRYVPEYAKRWDRLRRRVGGSWRVDETYSTPRRCRSPPHWDATPEHDWNAWSLNVPFFCYEKK